MQDLRCKTKTMDKAVTDISELPKWNFDGSSTGQAPGEHLSRARPVSPISPLARSWCTVGRKLLWATSNIRSRRDGRGGRLRGGRIPASSGCACLLSATPRRDRVRVSGSVRDSSAIGRGKVATDQRVVL